MNIPYIPTTLGLTFFFNSKLVDVDWLDPRFDQIQAALKTEDEHALERLLSITKNEYVFESVSETYNDLKFSKDTTSRKVTVTYRGLELPKVVSEMLIRLWDHGVTDFSHYFKFLDNLMKNPSDRAREELYSFLEACSLPITKDGYFIAYKGIQADRYSMHGNLSTRVISGEVNEQGQIKNKVGERIAVAAGDVDPNCNNPCSSGLHVGAYEYARAFGQIVIAVAVNPADVVSVPVDHNCMKCRVSAYQVLAEVYHEINEPEVDVNEEDYTVTPTEAENNMVEKMLNNDHILWTRDGIIRNIVNHGNETTVNQLCSTVGRKYGVTRASMLAILLRLGFDVKINTHALGKSTVTL
jgi:bacterioferritin-associated ferredoxin